MSRGLYFAYLKAWRKEHPASKYDLTPGAALMLRAIIDEVNAQFWPTTPVRIENQYFFDTCNFKNRMAIKRSRDLLMEQKLIKWHPDAANKNESGFYAISWMPNEVKIKLEEIRRNVYVTPTPLELRIIKGS